VPRLAKGELIGCFVSVTGTFVCTTLTELIAGSDRAQPWLGSCRHGDDRHGNRRRLRPVRLKDLDLQCARGVRSPRMLQSRFTQTHCSDVFIIWARCKWDGKVRGFILEKVGRDMSAPSNRRVTMCAGHEGALRAGDEEQGRAARVAHRVDLHGQRRSVARRAPAKVPRAQQCVQLPQQCAVSCGCMRVERGRLTPSDRYGISWGESSRRRLGLRRGTDTAQA
jgi:hypothetical protein